MADNEKSSIISVRAARTVLQTPPGTMGFSNLVKPDEAFGEIKFKVRHHYNPAGVEALKAALNQHCIDALWEKFLQECEKKKLPSAKMAKLVKPDAADWVDDHLKDPKEGSRIETPFIQYANDADYVDKKGVTQRKTMYAVAADGSPLDLAKLSLGMGSVVQVLLLPGLFMNALIKTPTPTLKLQGVKVLKAVQFGGGAGGSNVPETSDEDIQAILGADFEADDLSAYASSMTDGKRATTREDAPSNPDFMDDSDIPF